MSAISLLSPVAVLEDLPEHHITRGQIGTVVEALEHEGEQALLVEFSSEDGETYAIVPVKAEKLIELHRSTRAA